jgi:hypothetical protein
MGLAKTEIYRPTEIKCTLFSIFGHPAKGCYFTAASIKMNACYLWRFGVKQEINCLQRI